MSAGQKKRGANGEASSGFQLGPGIWARLRYQAFDAEGELVEDSASELGLVFGYGVLLPTVEAALEGLSVGSTRSVEVSARDAFGERRLELQLEIAREEFPPEVKEGDRFELERDDGTEVVARILGVEEDVVVLDLNHPLAGQRVRFEIEVLEARIATAEELELAEAALLAEAEDDAADPSEGLIPVASLLRRPSS